MKRTASKSSKASRLSLDLSGSERLKKFLRRLSTGGAPLTPAGQPKSPTTSSIAFNISDNDNLKDESPLEKSNVVQDSPDAQVLPEKSTEPAFSAESPVILPESSFNLEPPENEQHATLPHLTIGQAAIENEVIENQEPSLWANAMKHIPASDRAILETSGQVAKPEELIAETYKAREACIERQLNFRWRGEKFAMRDIAEKILAWVRKFKEIGDVVVQIDPIHASIPWAACRILMQCGLADTENLGTILIGIEKSTNIIGRCAVYERLYLPAKDHISVVLRSHLVEVYAAVLRLLVWGKKYFSKSTAVRITTAVFQDNLVKIMEDMDDREKVVLKDVAVIEAEYRILENQDISEKLQGLMLHSSYEHKRLRSLLEEFTQPIARIDFRIAAMEATHRENERAMILNWLSDIEYEKHYYKARAGRVEGTCKWLTGHEKFREWRSSISSSILLLRGDPGTGKSKLTATVTEACLEHRRDNESQEAIAYFYCDRNERDRTMDPEKIFLTLLKQLSYIGEGGPLQPLIVDEYQKRKNTGFASKHPEFDLCVHMIIRLSELYPQTVIIIDALDEINPEIRFDVIDGLRKIVEQSCGLVKLFISSRNEEDILAQFEDSVIHYITPSDNGHDIDLFVDVEFENYFASRRIRWKVDEGQKAEIKQSLKSSAHGMFLWVDYQLKSLSKLSHPDEIHDALQGLPKGLKESYDRIMDAIHQEEGLGRAVAFAALSLVAGANTPLRTDEMVGAVFWYPGIEKEFNVDTILGKCHGLVVLDPTLRVVRFNHLSCLEYLEKYQSFLVEQSATSFLASCLKLMMQPERATSPPLKAILQYATEQWIGLTQIAVIQGVEENAEMRELIRCFLAEHLKLGRYLVPDNNKGLRSGYPPAHAGQREYQKIFSITPRGEKPDPFLAAAFLGLLVIFEDAETYDLSLTNSYSESLLEIACKYGHIKVVQKLLKDGADPNLGERWWSSALSEAVLHNHVEIAEMLISQGADVNLFNPIIVAISEGYLEMTKLLLAKGARVNDTTNKKNFGDCLQVASYYGQLQIVEYLIDNGICNVNAPPSGIYGNALQIACVHSGDTSREVRLKCATHIIETLINHGADVNWIGGYHGSALQAACADSLSSENVAIVRYLLQRGADPNLAGGYYGSPLLAAVHCNDSAVVRLLLDAGADPNHPANRRALYNAVRRRRHEIAEFLVESGADCNALGGGHLGTPIHAAAANADEQMIKILLSGNANVNSWDWICRTPLLVVGISTVVDCDEADTCKTLLRLHGAEGSVVAAPNATSRDSRARAGVTFLARAVAGKRIDDTEKFLCLDLLGRCLLLCGNDDRAAKVFAITSRWSAAIAKGLQGYHRMCCVACMQDNTSLWPRWVCRSCVHVILCPDCYGSSSYHQYLSPAAKGCKENSHQFFEVVDPGGRTRSSSGLTFPEWLENLSVEYES